MMGGRRSANRRIALMLMLAMAAGAAPCAAPGQGVLGGPIGGTPTTPVWPVDHAASRADFFAFRAQLQAALARRDADALLAAVAPDIKNSFGGDEGVDGFVRLWRPREPDSRVYEELATVLALGGVFEGDETFIAPYVYARWPREFDPFEHVVLIAPDVRISTAPREGTEGAGVSSFVLYPLARNAKDVEGWTAVRTGHGIGYVPSFLVRSPIDYRAFFVKREGRWQLTIFVSGD